MQVHSALLFETPEEIYSRVFSILRPRTALPRIEVRFCRYANANSFVQMRDGMVLVRMTDLLEGAPALVLEALAYILLSKLFRQPVPRTYSERYRRYLNGREMRRSLHLVRRSRGRKFLSQPQGDVYNLDEIFEEMNWRHFGGLLARPRLGWSRRPSRTMLGHYDPSHDAIVISRILDRVEVPRLALEYVLFHEMLHLKFPVEHDGARRCLHTRAFREAERKFPHLNEAKRMLAKL